MRRPIHIAAGDDLRKTWRVTNANADSQSEIIAEVRRLRALVVQGGRGSFSTKREPFAVYVKPNALRVAADRNEDAWRKVFVQSGHANFVPCWDCNQADGPAGVGDAALEIEVPTGKAIFFVWCDFTDATEPRIKSTTFSGAGAATHWDTFPAVPSGIRPLANVDTLTHEAAKRAVIRQLQLGDIWPSGGSGSEVWS
jgi:hypothetical protein